MKITESQLRKLVKEEIDDMVDEGLFGGLGQLAKRGAEKVTKAGKAVAKTYKAGSLAADFLKAVTRVEKLVARLSKFDPELRSARIVQALNDMKKRAEHLKTQEE